MTTARRALHADLLRWLREHGWDARRDGLFDGSIRTTFRWSRAGRLRPFCYEAGQVVPPPAGGDGSWVASQRECSWSPLARMLVCAIRVTIPPDARDARAFLNIRMHLPCSIPFDASRLPQIELDAPAPPRPLAGEILAEGFMLRPMDVACARSHIRRT